MGGCRCSYRNCPNTTKSKENLHFFHYPVKQKQRCRQWIENAQKPQFYELDEDQLRNKVICQTHFEDYYFPNVQKKRLLQDAVPTLEGDSCLVEESPSALTLLSQNPLPLPPPPQRAALSTNVQEDMKIFPANDDGTLFVLETSNMMPNQFNSAKVESYIYTNNGLVLPINRHSSSSSTSTSDSVNSNGKHIFSNEQIIVERRSYPSDKRFDNLNLTNQINYSFPHPYISSPLQNHTQKSNKTNEIAEILKLEPTSGPQEKQLLCLQTQTSVQNLPKGINQQYEKTLKQHSKDIAIIKRILKKQRTSRRYNVFKPNIISVMNFLKREIPPSLLSLLKIHLHRPIESDDIQIFTDIHGTSPDLYKLLIEKHHWQLPNPTDINLAKKNGHIDVKE